MNAPEAPLSRDQAYLLARADAFGWTTAWEEDESGRRLGRMRLFLLDRSVTAVFSHDGAFWYGRASGPGSTGPELDLPAVADLLEEYGNRNPGPGSAPDLDSSTAPPPARPEPPHGRPVPDTMPADGDGPAETTPPAPHPPTDPPRAPE